MKFSVIGAGSWGTTIAWLLTSYEFPTTLWVRREELAEKIRKRRENPDYLPQANPTFPEHQPRVTSSLSEINWESVILIAVPSFAMNKIASKISRTANSKAKLKIINLAKGLEKDGNQLKTMSEVITEQLPHSEIFSLLGPSHAEEVAQNEPTAVTLAGNNQQLGKRLQQALTSSQFRVYLSTDLTGAEYCSSLKNIIALATGVSDGLGYGDNSKSALICRGLAELKKFGEEFEIQEETLFKLPGLGDLTATAISEHSRNRKVGERLGQGESIESIKDSMHQVAEGVRITPIVDEIARQRNLDLPITRAVHQVLQGEDPKQQVQKLMTREPKQE